MINKFYYNFSLLKKIQTNFPIIMSFECNLQEDLTSLGKLVLALACRCLHSVQEDRIQSSITLVSRNYSSDLRNLVL